MNAPDLSGQPSPVPSPALCLDCRGMLCPMPVIILGKRHTEVAVGEVITVLADDVAARTDIAAWARIRGQEFLGEDTAQGAPRYWVRRLG